MASSKRNRFAAGRTPEDPIEEASEVSFPASDSPAWNAGHDAARTPPSPVQTNTTTQGCAVSFLTEERKELDKLCERTPEERREEYTQPYKEKEVGEPNEFATEIAASRDLIGLQTAENSP
jgi:hypothetical protein